MDEPIFRTRGPLDPERDRALYIERPEIEHLLGLAQQSTVYNYVALLGSRQTGKTSLLYQARSLMAGRGCRVAFVDLSGLENQREADCYRHVCSQMLAELGEEVGLPGYERARLAAPNTALDFRTFLLRVAQATPAQRIVVMLDEVGAIPASASEPFFGIIRNIFSSRRKESEQALAKYVFIFSGAVDLHELTQGRNSPLNICERIYLRDLSRMGVRKLVANFNRKGIAVTREAADHIYNETRGHPYLVQRLCSLIEERGGQTVTPREVAWAISQMLRGDDNLDRLIRQVSQEKELEEFVREIVLEGRKVPFSRVNPLVARLEVLGSIRGEEFCAIRNPIYERALVNHFHSAARPKRAVRAKGRLRLPPLLLAILFLTSSPTTAFYVKDFILFPRAHVDHDLGFPDPEVRAVIHYEPVIRRGREQIIEVEIQRSPTARLPILAELQPQSLDLVSGDGKYILEFTSPHESKRFTIHLGEQLKLRDLVDPVTQERVVMVRVSSPTASRAYAATLRVDRITTFIASAIVWLGSLLMGASGALIQLEILRSLPERLRRILGGEG